MNKLDEHTIERIRTMVREGYSIRRIAMHANVSRATANTYTLKYRHEAPLCRHDKPLYECSPCCSSRRTVSSKRDIIWLKPGPRVRKNTTLEPSLSAEEVLVNALDDLRRDR